MGCQEEVLSLREYQDRTSTTDQFPEFPKRGNQKGIMVPLLGLASEVGALLNEYKKSLRDGAAYKKFNHQISEELGDVLWYVVNITTKFGLDLNEIAKENLSRVADRWPPRSLEESRVTRSKSFFDTEYDRKEQLPRKLHVQFRQEQVGKRTVVKLCNRDAEGKSIGNQLTDNAELDDGYRFHDVFHLAYTAVLRWSPVTRANLKCKRKSNPSVDEIEDGGRAIVIEEAIVAVVFDYARERDFLARVKTIDNGLLSLIKSMTADREVIAKPPNS